MQCKLIYYYQSVTPDPCFFPVGILCVLCVKVCLGRVVYAFLVGNRGVTLFLGVFGKDPCYFRQGFCVFYYFYKFSHLVILVVILVHGIIEICIWLALYGSFLSLPISFKKKGYVSAMSYGLFTTICLLKYTLLCASTSTFVLLGSMFWSEMYLYGVLSTKALSAIFPLI